ncbi:MAG: efflux RND transporter periplasmic adaptor subunit [Methylococcales bacterium]|nr:efflux RND transporter periplasmic adaptor subunit [Methylococcales bacterium]
MKSTQNMSISKKCRSGRFPDSILFFPVIAALFINGCEKPNEQAAASPPIVVVTEVIQKDVPIQQEWVGTLDGMVNAQINAQVNGYLIKRNYKEGDLVKKGQLLYEIDPRTFQANLDQEKSNLARQQAVLKTAQLDLARIKRLLPEKAVSVRDRDNAVGREASAQAEVLAAEAAVEKAQLDLGFTKIASPISGVAGISKAQLGDLVGPGSANNVLTSVSQVEPIRAYLGLSEQQYLQFAREKVNHDQRQEPIPLELILADGTTYPYGGKFYFADRQVDVNTGTIQVAVLFPNPGNLLRPGQFAKIRAVIKTETGALLVPQQAVTQLQSKFQIAVVDSGNTVGIRLVKPGERVGSLWIINEGLKPGDRVIVEGLQKVRNGMKVSPKPFTQPLETAPAPPSTSPAR